MVSHTVPGDKGRELEGGLLWDPPLCSAPSLPQLGPRRGSCRCLHMSSAGIPHTAQSLPENRCETRRFVKQSDGGS